MRSASPTPLQAAATIARSRRRLGAKMPGVSTNTDLRVAAHRDAEHALARGLHLGQTIEILAPIRRLSRVDLPALGAPMIATKPQRVGFRFGHER